MYKIRLQIQNKEYLEFWKDTRQLRHLWNLSSWKSVSQISDFPLDCVNFPV